MACQMWTLLLASSSSLGRPIGAPRVFLTRNTCYITIGIDLMDVQNILPHLILHKCTAFVRFF